MKSYKNSALLIAIAAFTVTASSVHAFGSHEFLTAAGLTDEQVVAVQEARELRRVGDIDAARDVLLEAGIDVEALQELRRTHREHKHEARQLFKEQVEQELTDEQRDALQVARSANDRDAVRAILEDAGIERPPHQHGHRHGRDRGGEE